ncbi:MAG: glycosyltransferase family 4 protein [Methanobacterium sp.]
MKEIKIALIVTLFPPKWIAGTEIASENIAKYLAKKGHEVHVITSLDNGLVAKEVKDNFYIHRINMKKIRLIGTAHFWVNIFLEIKKIKPDIIHIQTISIAVPGLLSKMFLKKPYIVYGRGADIYIPDKFTKLISKIVLKNANFVIALTQDMKEAMMKIYQRDIIVIPNGIDMERFKEISIRTSHNDKVKTILFVGTLRPVKGVIYLIEAMKIVKNEYHGAKLLIVGDGTEGDKLRAIVKELDLEDSVSFAGQRSNNEIPKYMAESDIFVLPSLSEGFPNVILEAMAVGLPVISSKVGGIPNIIQEGINGLLVEPMNSKDIANKILILLNNEDLRKKISINNKIYVQKYSLDTIVEKLEKIYIDAIFPTKKEGKYNNGIE